MVHVLRPGNAILAAQSRSPTWSKSHRHGPLGHQGLHAVAIEDSVVSLQKAEPSICRDEQDLDSKSFLRTALQKVVDLEGGSVGLPKPPIPAISVASARHHGAWMLFRLGQPLYNWTMFVAFPCKGCGMQLQTQVPFGNVKVVLLSLRTGK